VRRRFRALIKLIEIEARSVPYSDVKDRTGAITEIEVRGIPIGRDMEAFRRKLASFFAHTRTTSHCSGSAATSPWPI
jgi:type I restriction enzyme R subunit